MQKNTKITALLSILLIVCLALSSCSLYSSYDVDLPDIPKAEDINDIDDPALPDIKPPEKLDFGINDTFDPTKSLDGFYTYNYNFDYLTVATTSSNSALFTTTELYLDSCVYERNSHLEEKFSFKFTALTDKAATLAKDIANANKNNSSYADLVALSLADLSAFEDKDLLCDLSSLPFVGPLAESSKESEALSLESEFFIANEASILPSQTRVLFFNTELLKTAKKESPYTLLSSKKWTWNALASYLEKDEKLASSDDIAKLIEATVKNAGADDAEKEAISKKIKELSDTLSASVVKTDAKAKFLAGEALFYLGTFADIIDVTSKDTVCGLLPLPVFEEGDEYSDVHDAKNVIVYACPKNATDIERSAFMIAAITAASEGSRANAFTRILDGSLLRDNGSRLSLGYIFGAEYEIIY